ncbi:uncharacterized protein LOC134932324 [Pseudophryne corroboree]|uniref:uncharacterized protein LOC134932324 n=1 Tax=Pseudophryne corroboree TaxID=495146 RepID=UPI003081DDAF
MLCTHTASAEEYGNTPLHYAAHAGNIDRVIKLIQDGYKILCKNMSGLTPLHFAAFGGKVHVLEKFLPECSHAINLQSILTGSSLLHEAVLGKSIETVDFLLERGAKTNLQDKQGNTPLHLAAVLNDADMSVAICQTLLEHGSNPDIQNLAKENFAFTVVRGAAVEGGRRSQRLISLALTHRPNLLSRNSDGLTLLDLARKISVPPAIIWAIQEQTQEQQMLFLSQRPLQPPSGQSRRPDEFVSSETSIMDGGRWRPGKKVKLFICGHSGVGKTTFANALTETGSFAKLQYYLTGPKTPVSTKGVSCSQTDVKDCSLVIWDFAGQMEYCFTHSLLLNTSGPNTVYCLIFSLKGIETDLHGGQRHALEQLMFWLRFLSVTHNSQSKPRVFLIGSFLDALPEENKAEIANQFYENVMKREIKLFNCFQKQFVAINCRNMADVEPIREALEETVTQIHKNSKDVPVPEICQLVMKQVLHLRTQKVRFQRLKELGHKIEQDVSNPVCPTTLLTAVEYLHNICELLYLPHYFPSRTYSTTNSDQHFTPELQSYSTSPPHALSLGVVILDLEWLLQDIFARFGNFALSPASGTNQQQWSFEEVVAALNLTDGEGDAETALELLEAFELLLKTPEGEFVVPGWLKRGGPERHGCWKNVRGVVYRWKDGSRGIFSHFFVGRLQIQLMRIFGSQRCQLWKEGALLVTNAQLRVDVSEDKRSLYLTGNWRVKYKEEDCYNLLEKVGKEVEMLLRNELEQQYEKLHLCPTELSNITVASRIDTVVGCILKEAQIPLSAAITEELCGFSFEQILEAEKNNSSLCGRVGNIQPWEVLFPQHDTRMLFRLGINCTTRWLEGSTLMRLCCLLDTPHPQGLDWKMLAELLGNATNSVVLEIEEEARNRGLSPTSLVLNRFPVTLGQLRQSLSQIQREDCMAEIDKMITQFCMISR